MIRDALISKHPSSLPLPTEDLIRAANALSLEGNAFINGKYCAPQGGRFIEKTTPITGRVFSTVASCDHRDVDLAVASARRAFDDGRWAQLAPSARKNILLSFADLIEKNADELALIDAIDMGKPVEAARSVDVNSCLAALRWNAELIDKVYGQVAPTSALDIIIHEPLGVVGIIIPWNYPLMLASWKFSAALAAGNCVILKPSELSPFSAIKLGGIALAAGIPEGVFNVLPGGGADVGKPLGCHTEVDCIAFTGSTCVGKKFFEYSGQSTIKSISLECGGKNPCIITADADLKTAAAKVAFATFYNAGQSCNAPGRILVHSSKMDEFVHILCCEADSFTPSHPLLRGAKVGAMGSLEHLTRVAAMVKRGIEQGATVACGGQSLFVDSGGAYFAPTVIKGVCPDMDLARSEIFGPVLPVEKYDDLDSAIASANNTQFGLWAGIWTSSLRTAQKCIRQLRFGTVAVNGVFGGDITTPFGGYKQSGVGRDRSVYGFLKYTQTKHVHFAV